MKKKLFTRHICLLIPDEVYNTIREITDKQEISISEYLRYAIQEKLEREVDLS